MLLDPDASWCWIFDKEIKQLRLTIKGASHYTAHAADEYLPDVFGVNPFSLDDINFMNKLADALAPLSLTLTETLYQDILINATAVNRFYKELVVKSWVFKQQADVYRPFFGEIIYLESDDSSEYGPFVAIQSDNTTTTCLSMTARVMEYKTQKYIKPIHYCQAVKVMNNRIHGEIKKSEYEQSQFYVKLQNVI